MSPVPRLARRLVEIAVADPHREFLLGDLEEQYARTRASRGAVAAHLGYWRQAIGAAIRTWQLDRRRADARDDRGRSRVMAHLSGDVRASLRAIWRSPGFSLVSMLTLALAIGANTLMFSIANPLLVRALPIEDPATLGWVTMTHAEREVTRGRSSVPDLIEWRDQARSFSALAGYGVRPATLTGRGDAQRITVARATANLPDVWGLRPVVGRTFLPGEDAPGRPLVGVLSYRYWREAFQADPGVVGTTLLLDSAPVTVVGVMPAAIELGNLSLIDMWTPLALDPSAPRDARWVLPVGRLASGATVASAHAELQTIFRAQQAAHPTAHDGWSAAVVDTHGALASPDTWVLLALLGVVVLFVLLIACANLANLVLARLVARRREIDVRLAIGASRWRVVRPMLIEGVLLSLAGGLGGLAIAYGGLRLINAVAFEAFFRLVSIDTNVLIFAALISVVAPLLFSLWPALSAGRPIDGSALHGARVGGGRAATRRRNLLVGAQVALALSLLVVSTLGVRSMLYLQQADFGYDPAPLLSWRVSLPADRYADDASHARFAADLEAALRRQPGAERVAVASHLPVIHPDSSRALTGTNRDGDVESDRPWASLFSVSPAFFETLAIPALSGRAFADADREGAEPVAIVNRLAAERYFDGIGEALGRRVTIHDARRGDRVVTVVGVVADTRDSNLLRTSPQIYVPFAQWPSPDPVGLIRSADPLAIAATVRPTVRAADAEVPVSDLKPLTQIIGEEQSSTGILGGLFVSFGVLALLLAAAGLFGVISYTVGQQRREIGVRLALGAAPAAVARMVIVNGLKVTVAGAAVGVVLAAVLARLSASILAGVSPFDPATFIGVTTLVIGVSVLASASPALRAMRIDPARSLRAE